MLPECYGVARYGHNCHSLFPNDYKPLAPMGHTSINEYSILNYAGDLTRQASHAFRR